MDNFRYEKKIIISELSVKEVELLLKLHPAVFCEKYNQRFVNNIYFDSINMENYQDNVDGSANRNKVRIRWYGDIHGQIGEANLEIKIKKGAVGTKLKLKVDPFYFIGAVDTNLWAKLISSLKTSSKLKKDLSFLKPTILTRYCRKYYESFDNKFRITIDTQMQYDRINSKDSRLIKRYRSYSIVILELKYNSDKGTEAESIINKFPFRISKNSKYVNGLKFLAY